MKNILPLLFLLFGLSTFAQDKVARITSEYLDASTGDWILEWEDSWEYDHQDRETIYTHFDFWGGDFWGDQNLTRTSFYNEHGNLSQQKAIDIGSNNYEKLITYQYDEQQRLSEEKTATSYPGNNSYYYDKWVYHWDETGQISYNSYYTSNLPDETWILQFRRDSVFNDNGCLIEQTNTSYNNDQETSISHYVMTYDQNCNLLSREYWYKNTPLDNLVRNDQTLYEYSNNGKTVKTIYRRVNPSTNQMEVQYVTETEVNEAEQTLRYFFEYHYPELIDTTLQLYTYTAQGKIATNERYQSRHISEGLPLRLTSAINYVYYYDEAEQLIKEEQFIHYPEEGTERYFYTDHEYYCKGRVKQSIATYGPASKVRLRYNYHSETGCDLAESEKPEVKISPNPSNGAFTIESNLLSTEDATIQIYSILGREVYYRKLNLLADYFYLDFSTLPKGRYVVTVANKDEMQSQLIVVN